jgi:catechol 2,3-dioxygenase-like lactoylglutathione lyase family enzyme
MLVFLIRNRFSIRRFLMRSVIPCLSLFLSLCAICTVIGSRPDDPAIAAAKTELKLGNFSVSLNVKDIHASKEFYEKLGFKVSGGDLKRNYIVLQNNTSTIGLFQGMFDKNSLTYNPGWDRDKNTLPEFQDVREIQQELIKRGLKPVVAADESTDGPAFLTLADPDGNPILIDQHVPKPKNKP